MGPVGARWFAGIGSNANDQNPVYVKSDVADELVIVRIDERLNDLRQLAEDQSSNRTRHSGDCQGNHECHPFRRKLVPSLLEEKAIEVSQVEVIDRKQSLRQLTVWWQNDHSRPTATPLFALTCPHLLTS